MKILIHFILALILLSHAYILFADTDRSKPVLSHKQVSPEKKLTEKEVAGLLEKAGFKNTIIPTMVCIAKYESSYNSQALNVNRDKSVDYGLFQINGRWWHDKCDLNKLLNAEYNTQCAKIVYDKQGLTAWYGYQYNKKSVTVIS